MNQGCSLCAGGPLKGSCVSLFFYEELTGHTREGTGGNSLTKQIINLIRHLSRLSEHRPLCGFVVKKRQTVWGHSANLFLDF